MRLVLERSSSRRFDSSGSVGQHRGTPVAKWIIRQVQDAQAGSRVRLAKLLDGVRAEPVRGQVQGSNCGDCTSWPLPPRIPGTPGCVRSPVQAIAGSGKSRSRRGPAPDRAETPGLSERSRIVQPRRAGSAEEVLGIDAGDAVRRQGEGSRRAARGSRPGRRPERRGRHRVRAQVERLQARKRGERASVRSL